MLYKTLLHLFAIAFTCNVFAYGQTCAPGAVSDFTVFSLLTTLSSTNETFLLFVVRSAPLPYCEVEFHLTITDEDLGVVHDSRGTNGSIKLDDFMSPCAELKMEVRVANGDTEGPVNTRGVTGVPRPQVAPTLRKLDVEATSLNMTWVLEGNANRCPLKALYVQGPYLNVTVPLEDWEDKTTVPVQLDSLKPNSMYYFNVTVENSEGISPATAMAVQTAE
ncbi:hypothetical protein NQ315_001360 [Exocentrus adspersus]|uniref:Fibronectin type-III domain-containing protein n=1 Tax=Exocentrus adspersus TaxID=1586481 RepID=A0AAV8WGH6_9CUCU|nr:hypothetical protein NQ315_001360 [Exocentrus adspersus]